MSDNAKHTGAAHLTDANYEAALKEAGGKPVLIDFYAEWCGPCKLAAPIIDKLADEFAEKMVIVKIDVDENNPTAQKFGVMSIPTVVVLKRDGDQMKEINRQIGFAGEEGYRKMIDKALAN